MTIRLLGLPVARDENWPSIDLCAEMLAERLCRDHAGTITLEMALPKFRSPCSRISFARQSRLLRNVDRLIGRFIDYPREVRRLRGSFDLFHLCDHSYSQLIHDLPAGRCGVLCHDLDVFRCVLEPEMERRPWWFRQMTRRILDGFQKAGVVFYTTQHVRSKIEAYGLIDSTRLVQAPLGIAPEFARESTGNISPQIAARIPSGPYLLHVGSCIPRKRIDVLLNVVAGVRARRPNIALVKGGGTFTQEQCDQIQKIGLNDAIIHITGVSRSDLAALYRGAAATLVTSDREGFGLPVIEALACGSIVIANDLSPLREGGGSAAVYVPITEIDEWVRQTLDVIDDPETAPPLETRQAQARQFSWEVHAQVIRDTYLRISEGLKPAVVPLVTMPTI